MTTSSSGATNKIDPSRHGFPLPPTRSSSLLSLVDKNLWELPNSNTDPTQDDDDSDSASESSFAESAANFIVYGLHKVQISSQQQQDWHHGGEEDAHSVSLCDLNDAKSDLRKSNSNKKFNGGHSLPTLESFCHGSFAGSLASSNFVSGDESRASLDCSIDIEALKEKCRERPSRDNSKNELQPIVKATTTSRSQECRWDASRHSSRDSLPSFPSFSRRGCEKSRTS